jgi:hypothetical protein
MNENENENERRACSLMNEDIAAIYPVANVINKRPSDAYRVEKSIHNSKLKE